MIAVQLSIRGVREHTSRRGERYWRVETDLGTFYAWSARVAKELVPGTIVQARIAPRRTGFWHILAAIPMREAPQDGWQGLAGALLEAADGSGPGERMTAACLRCLAPIPSLHTLCPDCLTANAACVGCGALLPERGYAYCAGCAASAEPEQA